MLHEKFLSASILKKSSYKHPKGNRIFKDVC